MSNDELPGEGSKDAANAQTEFTPGPWRTGWSFDRNRSENALAVWPANVIDGMVGNPICLLSPENKVDATDEANAALIAAAPELLVLMKEIHRYLTDDDYRIQEDNRAILATDGNVTYQDHLINEIKEAIAKAEGKEANNG